MNLLLEVVLGLGIFALSILMIFGVFPYAQRAITQSKNVAVAHNLARDFLDRERALTYPDVGNVTPASVSPPEIVPVNTTVNGVTARTIFEVTVRVDELELNKRKVITVEVVWEEGPIKRQARMESTKVQYPGLVGS